MKKKKEIFQVVLVETDQPIEVGSIIKCVKTREQSPFPEDYKVGSLYLNRNWNVNKEQGYFVACHIHVVSFRRTEYISPEALTQSLMQNRRFLASSIGNGEAASFRDVVATTDVNSDADAINSAFVDNYIFNWNLGRKIKFVEVESPKEKNIGGRTYCKVSAYQDYSRDKFMAIYFFLLAAFASACCIYMAYFF